MFAGIAGVDSGNAALLVGGPPGVELHTMVDELPTGVTGDMVPVMLPRIGVMVPSGVDCIIMAVVPGMDVESVPGAVDGGSASVGVMEGDGRAGDGRAGNVGGCATGMAVRGATVAADVSGCWDHVNGAIATGGGADIVRAAETGGIVPIVVAVAVMDGGVEITVTAGVPGVICPVGVAQLTTVPGIVGSEASGTGANVVSGAPGWVVAENGPGPLRGEVTIAPGVDGRPMAVVPMVETCARLALQPNSSVAASKRRIAIAPPRQTQLVCGLRTATLLPSVRFIIGLRMT